MICGRCRASSPDSVRFCPSCGAAPILALDATEPLSKPERITPTLGMFKRELLCVSLILGLGFIWFVSPWKAAEVARVNGDAMCTTSASDLGFATSALNRGDEGTITGLVMRGRATRVGSGTQVSVIWRDRDEGRALVKLETGASLGTTCWLPILEAR